MYKDYDAEQVMLSEELRKKREDQLYSERKKSARSAAQTPLVSKVICSTKEKN
jgi:hypothetical protein